MLTDSKGTEHVLCGIGNVPKFALPVGLFLPLASFVVVLFVGAVLFLLYSLGLFDGMLGVQGRPYSPPVTLERLVVGDKLEEVAENASREPTPAEKAARAAAGQANERQRTAYGTPMANEVDLPPIPSAMERFHKVLSGPSAQGEVPQGRPVPKPISRVDAELQKTVPEPVPATKTETGGT